MAHRKHEPKKTRPTRQSPNRHQRRIRPSVALRRDSRDPFDVIQEHAQIPIAALAQELELEGSLATTAITLVEERDSLGRHLWVHDDLQSVLTVPFRCGPPGRFQIHCVPLDDLVRVLSEYEPTMADSMRSQTIVPPSAAVIVVFAFDSASCFAVPMESLR